MLEEDSLQIVALVDVNGPLISVISVFSICMHDLLWGVVDCTQHHS